MAKAFDHGKAVQLVRATDKVGALLVVAAGGAYCWHHFYGPKDDAKGAPAPPQKSQGAAK